MNDDLISREAVGYYIQSYIHEIITESGTDKNEHTNSILRAILNGIKTMPSVTPKAKMGRWIFHKPFDNGRKNCNECIECSQCHTWFGYAKTPYCPNCGAKMQEVEE